MPKIAEFHSTHEANKPAGSPVHHNNSACAPGRDIPQNERQAGTGGYRLCDDCQRLNKENK
jgi:hypothetical protein